MENVLEKRVLRHDGPIKVIAVMMADPDTTVDDRDFDTPEHERDYRARFEADEFDYVGMAVRVELNGVCLHIDTLWGIEHGTVAENVEADAWELTPYQHLPNGAHQMASPLSGVLAEALWSAQDWLEHSPAHHAALTAALAWADPVGAKEPTTYTVVGVLSDQGRLTVAGVIAGRHPMADIDSGDGGRWAGSFEATDAGDAERQAHEQAAENGGAGMTIWTANVERARLRVGDRLLTESMRTWGEITSIDPYVHSPGCPPHPDWDVATFQNGYEMTLSGWLLIPDHNQPLNQTANGDSGQIRP